MTSRTSSRRGSGLAQKSAAASGAVLGFTLMEMLVVLSILAILMGISIGAFRRGIPSRDVARNALLDALRQARLFAVAENAPASVVLDDGTADGWPTVTANGHKTVACWHLEGTDLSGWPRDARGEGIAEEPRGKLGKAVRLSDTLPSWINFGQTIAFDSTGGFGVECFINVDQVRSEPLIAKGRSFTLRSEADGGLTAQIRVMGKDERGDPKPIFQSASSQRAVLEPGKWVKVSVTYDGAVLRIASDDAPVAVEPLRARAAFVPDPPADLVVGSEEAPAAFALDEMKWAIYASQTQELHDVTIGGQQRVVRFGPDGALDSRYHQAPAELCLLTPSSEPEQPPLETWVRVGMLGDVH